MSSLNKVVILKLIPKFKDDSFNTEFNSVMSLTRQFFNKLPYFSDKETIRTYENEFNVEDKRKEVYEKTDKSISYDLFVKMLKYVQDSIINCTAREITNPLVDPQHSELLNESDINLLNTKNFISIKKSFKELKSESTTKVENVPIILLGKCINTFHKIGFWNIFCEKSNSNKYIVTGNAQRLYTSWYECDKIRRDSYNDDEKYINDELGKLTDDEKNILSDLVNFSVENNHCKKFHDNILSYHNDCLFPNFRHQIETNGKVDIKNITEHFIIRYKNNKQVKSKFSLNSDYIQYLIDHPILWKLNNKESCLFSDNCELLSFMTIHAKHKPSAIYPLFNETDIHKFQYLLGSNYVKFSLNYEGTVLDNVTFNDEEYINGKHINGLELNILDNMNFDVCLNKKYYNGKFNPNPYFKNLRIWKNKEKMIYLFRFEKHGIEVNMLVKEPSIVFNSENKNYEIRFNMSSDQIHSNHGLTEKNIEEISWYFKTALPLSLSEKDSLTENDKQKERFNNISGKTVKAMGVDLGLRKSFSWSVCEYTINKLTDYDALNNIHVISTGEYNPTNPEIYNKYDILLKEMNIVRHILSISRKLRSSCFSELLDKYTEKDALDEINDKDSNIVEFINKVKNHPFFKNKENKIYTSFNEQVTENIISNFVKMSINDNVDAKIIRYNRNWLPHILSKYIKFVLNEYKTERQFTANIFPAEIKWIELLLGFKKIMSGLYYFGMTNEEKKINKFVFKMDEYIQNCKDNYIKQLSWKIVENAVKNKCHFICLEGLNSSKMTKRKNKRDNFMASLWSPQNLKNAIINAASWFGICVIDDVDEKCTSQIYHKTNSFGLRDGSSFYYIENNELKEIDSDINAACNIAKRFLSRYLNIVQFNVKLSSDETDAGSQKRIKSFLTYKFGNMAKAKQFFKNIDPSRLTWINDKGKSIVSPYIYYNNGTWITQKERIDIENKIKSLLPNYEKVKE